MITDIISKVEQWSEEKKLPDKQKKAFINIARMYQHGDPLPPEEEEIIADIIDEIERLYNKGNSV